MVEKTGITDSAQIKQILEVEGYREIYQWEDPPLSYYDWHSHPFDEVRWIIDGEIRIGTTGDVITLKPGDRFNVEAGTLHWAEVGERGVKYVCGTKRYKRSPFIGNKKYFKF